MVNVTVDVMVSRLGLHWETEMVELRDRSSGTEMEFGSV